MKAGVQQATRLVLENSFIALGLTTALEDRKRACIGLFHDIELKEALRHCVFGSGTAQPLRSHPIGSVTSFARSVTACCCQFHICLHLYGRQWSASAYETIRKRTESGAKMCDWLDHLLCGASVLHGCKSS